MKRCISQIFVSLIFCFSCAACVKEKMLINEKLAGSIVYYVDFSGLPGTKGLPFVPSDQVTEEKAFELNHYLKATYDSNGRMIELENVKNGKLLFRQVVTYKGDKYETAKLFDKEGKVMMQLP